MLQNKLEWNKKSPPVPMQKVEKRIKLVPPDGGWGWMVVLGTACSSMFNQSMFSLFSLVYGDALEAMGHRTQGAAIVLNTTLFVTNFGGPTAAAILKKTSPRVVAIIGICFCVAGIFFSGFSTNIWHLIITCGILLGTGLGFLQNSTFVALNSYFKLKKSRAVGLANVGTGIGQVLVPHLVKYFLEEYGFRGTCMLLSGLSLNGLCGTLLLQPVEWHMKKIEEEVLVDDKSQCLKKNHINLKQNSTDENVSENNSNLTGEINTTFKDTEQKSYDFRKEYETKNKNPLEKGLNGKANVPITQKKNIFRKIYVLFDISLLTSPRFLNIIIGAALLVTSIQNYSLLFPIFLQKVALMDKQQTATCMSAVAIADIAGRLILPVFQDKYRIKARWMLIMTCTWLIIIRQIMAYLTSMPTLIAMSCLYGFGRSVTIVARNIAISENCRIDQVPTAVGLGMLVVGISILPLGYFLGWIRDYTESYIVCITAQNILLLLLLITWTPDMIMLWYSEKQKKIKVVEEIQM